MRAIPAASAVLLGAAALAGCAPAGAVGGITPFGYRVQPSSVAPGGEVALRVDRYDGGCRGRATVSSGVFDTVVIPRGETSATAVVDRAARPGAVYQVAFSCDGATGTTGLTITGGHGGRTEHPKGVHAGEGGSVAGLDAKELGLGGVLVAASIAAAHHFSRRRSGDEGA
ncbi:hypothetical protein [Streptomyces sp. NPDC003717]|uniref:hypothetical protein n=1 Tax=Streptomyces sp. NPDC003717 TaxID=3154276 RepID=UPI0033A0F4C9